MKSLQFRLSVAVSTAATAVALLAGVWSFVAAFEDAREIQDQRLIATARLFASYDLPIQVHPESGPEPEFDAAIIVEPVRGGGTHFFKLPRDVSDGFRTSVVAGEEWRILIHTAASGRQRLVVGQRTQMRDHLAWDAGLWTSVPLLLLVPLLSAVIFLLVQQMLKPITILSASLDRRTDADLRPVQTTGLPTEIGPIVAAINSLLQRLSHSIELQRRFIADAAHELRSPLAALSVQIDNLGNSLAGEQATTRIAPLRRGIVRTRSLLEQLLAMARAQQSQPQADTWCQVESVLRSVIEALLPIAENKSVEIDVVRLDSLSVAMSELDLTLIVKNLLDNAIRYSAAGGTIEIGIWNCGHLTTIEVKDHGPGIPPAERERVFDPFYRILGNDEPGSGLGLAIVKAIVEKLGGSIKLGWTLDRPQRGLMIQVLLPVSMPPERHLPDDGLNSPLSQRHVASR